MFYSFNVFKSYMCDDLVQGYGQELEHITEDVYLVKMNLGRMLAI